MKIDIPVSQPYRVDIAPGLLDDLGRYVSSGTAALVVTEEHVAPLRLERACRACGIYHFIETLPHGFDTVLRENVAISAGQKQLLTIARAMLQNAPMLILDEATSSVDTRTELLIQRAMDKLTENRTSFVIAHRLSTVQNSDAIMVLDHGRIIERGTHDDLIAQKGTYYQLYTGAFELE